MSGPRDRFDELERERWFKENLGAALLGYIDHKREPYEVLIDEEAIEDDELDLESMGIAPFVARDEVD